LATNLAGDYDDVFRPATATTSGRHYLLFGAWPLGVASDFWTSQCERYHKL